MPPSRRKAKATVKTTPGVKKSRRGAKCDSPTPSTPSTPSVEASVSPQLSSLQAGAKAVSPLPESPRAVAKSVSPLPESPRVVAKSAPSCPAMADPVTPIRAVRLVTGGSYHVYGTPTLDVFNELPTRKQKKEYAANYSKDIEYRARMHDKLGSNWVNIVAEWNRQGRDGTPPPEFNPTNKLNPDAWRTFLSEGGAVTKATKSGDVNTSEMEDTSDLDAKRPRPRSAFLRRPGPAPAPTPKPLPDIPDESLTDIPDESLPDIPDESLPDIPDGSVLQPTSTPKPRAQPVRGRQPGKKRGNGRNTRSTNPAQARIIKKNAQFLLDALNTEQISTGTEIAGGSADVIRDKEISTAPEIAGDSTEVVGDQSTVPFEMLQRAAETLSRLAPPPVMQIMSPIGDSGYNHKFLFNRPTLVSISVGGVGIGYGLESKNLMDVLLPDIHFIRVRPRKAPVALTSWEQLRTENPIILKNKLIDAISENQQTLREYILCLVAEGVVSPLADDFLKQVSSRIKNVTVPEFGFAEMSALINISTYMHARTEGAVGTPCVPSFTLFELVQPDDVRATLGKEEKYDFPPIASCGLNKRFSAVSYDLKPPQSNCLAVLFRKGADGDRIYRRLLIGESQPDEQVRSKEFKDAFRCFEDMCNDKDSLKSLEKWINANDKEIEQLRAAAIKIGTDAGWRLPA